MIYTLYTTRRNNYIILEFVIFKYRDWTVEEIKQQFTFLYIDLLHGGNNNNWNFFYNLLINLIVKPEVEFWVL